ncbi:MAG TPA: hypothetical protein VFG73_04535 [Rhodanobacteraceae bacterium]|nr:hypothetical protein [Rhodanobacteraceae bacterium]
MRAIAPLRGGRRRARVRLLQSRNGSAEGGHIVRHRQPLDRDLDRWQGKLPRWAGRAMRWLRRPSSRWVRIPAGVLLIIGGIFGFLPILGLWMLPLGLLLLAQDLPFLQRPMRIALIATKRRWHRLRLWLLRRRRRRSRDTG